MFKGINLPDHEDLFEHVSKTLEPIVASSARVWARDCNTLKDMLEETVLQLITNPSQVCTKLLAKHIYEIDLHHITNINLVSSKLFVIDRQTNLLSISQKHPGSIRKPQCTMRALVSWKKENYSTDSIFAIVLPDFESFSPKVLQDFILVIR